MANSSPVYDWFQERLEIQDIADDIGTKYVPPHVNIFYCLGGITLVCFLIQFATGFAMTFYYKPTVAEAYTSVQYLMTDVSFGWLIRSVHRWSASMMVLMLILHDGLDVVSACRKAGISDKSYYYWRNNFNTSSSE